MGRVGQDYNFKYAYKPCGTPEDMAKPSGKCMNGAKENCPWFSMCDLPEKTPWEKPTRPKKYLKSKYL